MVNLVMLQGFYIILPFLT